MDLSKGLNLGFSPGSEILQFGISFVLTFLQNMTYFELFFKLQ